MYGIILRTQWSQGEVIRAMYLFQQLQYSNKIHNRNSGIFVSFVDNKWGN